MDAQRSKFYDILLIPKRTLGTPYLKQKRYFLIFPINCSRGVSAIMNSHELCVFELSKMAVHLSEGSKMKLKTLYLHKTAISTRSICSDFVTARSRTGLSLQTSGDRKRPWMQPAIPQMVFQILT